LTATDYHKERQAEEDLEVKELKRRQRKRGAGTPVAPGYINGSEDEEERPADEDGDVATDEVYNANAEEDVDELLSVSASFNTLSLVHRDEGLMRFVKYVSHLAPSSRWDIAAQYTVEGVADSDEAKTTRKTRKKRTVCNSVLAKICSIIVLLPSQVLPLLV